MCIGSSKEVSDQEAVCPWDHSFGFNKVLLVSQSNILTVQALRSNKQDRTYSYNL